MTTQEQLTAWENGRAELPTDIQDWVVSGMLPDDVAARFADEINAACDSLEKEGNS